MKPEYQFYKNIIPSNQTAGIFWDLMHEIMSGKTTVRNHVPEYQKSTTLGQSRLPPRFSPTGLINRLQMDAKNQPPFSPTVGALAGRAWQITKKIPDSAVIQLYCDGGDWIAPHLDYEGAVGPTPEDVIVPIFSFGQSRRLEFYPIQSPEICIDSIDMDDGSLLVMRGTTQRHYLHSIIYDDTISSPRISVSFMYDQKDEKSAHYLLTEQFDNSSKKKQRFVGPYEDCVRMWLKIAKEEGLSNLHGGNGGPHLLIVCPNLKNILHPEDAIYNSEIPPNKSEDLHIEYDKICAADPVAIRCVRRR